MTNKLPVIGKRYKATSTLDFFNLDDEVELLAVNGGTYIVSFKHKYFYAKFYIKEDLWHPNFKELPDQEPIKTTLIEWIDNQDINVDVLSPRELIILISEFYDMQ